MHTLKYSLLREIIDCKIINQVPLWHIQSLRREIGEEQEGGDFDVEVMKSPVIYLYNIIITKGVVITFRLAKYSTIGKINGGA